MQSRTKSSVINSLTSITTQILTVVMNFVVKIVFTRTISMEYLGVNGLFANIITMLSLADLGIGTAIPYSLYKPLAENDHRKVKILMKFYSKVYNVIGTVVLLIGLGLIPFLPYLIKGGEGVDNLSFIYALFVIHSASSYFFVYKRFLIESDQKGYITARITFAFSFLLSLVQIAILYLYHNFIFYLLSSIVFVVLQNIYISRKATKLYPYLKEEVKDEMDKDDVKEITKNVSSLFVYKVGSVVTNGTDNMVISKFLGLVPVGIYSNYVLVTKSLNNVVSQLFTAITSSIGNLVVTTNKEHSKNVFENLLFLNFWFYSLFSIALLVLINPFIDIFFGNKFVLSQYVVFALVVDFYLNGMQSVSTSFLNAYGLFYEGRFRPIFMIIINLVVSLILVIPFGITGVLLGTIISRITTICWMDPRIVYKYGFKNEKAVWSYYKNYIIYFFLFITIGLIIYYIFRNVVISNIIIWVIMGVIISIIVNLLFVLLFFRTGRFKYFYNKIKNLLLRKFRHQS